MSDFIIDSERPIVDLIRILNECRERIEYHESVTRSVTPTTEFAARKFVKILKDRGNSDHLDTEDDFISPEFRPTQC